jgi:hypothetical protein
MEDAMNEFRMLAALVLSISAVGCAGVPEATDDDSDTDDLSATTYSMAMVRQDPALAPGVVVPDGTFIKGHPRPLSTDSTAARHGSAWRIDDASSAWLFDANGLNQFKSLPDPAMDKDGAKIGSYARKPGDLYAADGVLKWDNVEQGYLGDCYFVAAMSAVIFADKSGALTKKMVVPNVVGGKVVSYFVTFFQASGRKVKIEVDPDLPHATKDGGVLYAESTDNQPGYEEWAPSLIEKGYAVWHGSYTAIGSGGTAADAIFALSGKATRSYDPKAAATATAIGKAGKAGKAQVACTFGDHDGVNYDGTGIYSDHCYSLRGIDTRGGKTYVQLRNPWGPQTATSGPVEPPDDGVQDGIFELELSKFQTLYWSVDIVK